MMINKIDLKPSRFILNPFLTLLFVALSFYLTVHGASASQVECDLRDDGSSNLSNLVSIIRNKSCNIKSADNLLAKMPESVRSRFVLMYRSQSLQGPHTVDYQNPRAILATTYDRDARKRLYLSFNGKQSQANHNNIEVLEIDTAVPEKRADIFNYFDIKFPSDAESKTLTWEDAQAKITISEPNPAKCVACHGKPAKPIFQSYPIWKGAYGAFHLTIDTKEREELEKLVASTRSNSISRYRHLVFIDESDISDEKHDSILSGQNNVDFNISLSVPNRLRIARLARKTKDYKKFVAATLGASLGCSDFQGFFPPQLKSILDSNIETSMSLSTKYNDAVTDQILWGFYNLGPNQFGSMISAAKERKGLTFSESIDWSAFSEVHRNFWGDWTTMNRLWIDTMKRQGHHRPDEGIAKLRYIYEGRGIDISSWFIDIVQPTYRMSDGFQWAEGLAWAFFDDDPGLSKYAALARKANYGSPYYDGKFPDEKEIENSKAKLCSQLKEESLVALSPLNQIPMLAQNSFDQVIHRGTFPTTFVNTCAVCHTHQSIGPKIPFLDSSSFKNWYLFSSNRAKILYRLTTPNALDRMPLNRVLEANELSSILEYLNLLKE